jgi:hypothetical protein
VVKLVKPALSIFITGYAENAVMHHGHLSHNMHVMMKPFAMGALADRVKDILAGTPNIRPPQSS